MKDYYIQLARKALTEYLNSGRIIDLPDDSPKNLKNKQAGVFVSFHKGDELRGCIGTFMPTKSCLGEEIISSAVAASQDPRFMPINKRELPELKAKVDVLSTPEKAEISDLDPKIYGVIVGAKDGRKGLLLPDLEGVETVEQQIEICRQKAGISPDEEIELYRFKVERHTENDK
jgi:AmmeMemoRadiSam system protein A